MTSNIQNMMPSREVTAFYIGGMVYVAVLYKIDQYLFPQNKESKFAETARMMVPLGLYFTYAAVNATTYLVQLDQNSYLRFLPLTLTVGFLSISICLAYFKKATKPPPPSPTYSFDVVKKTESYTPSPDGLYDQFSNALKSKKIVFLFGTEEKQKALIYDYEQKNPQQIYQYNNSHKKHENLVRDLLKETNPFFYKREIPIVWIDEPDPISVFLPEARKELKDKNGTISTPIIATSYKDYPRKIPNPCISDIAVVINVDENPPADGFVAIEAPAEYEPPTNQLYEKIETALRTETLVFLLGTNQKQKALIYAYVQKNPQTIYHYNSVYAKPGSVSEELKKQTKSWVNPHSIPIIWVDDLNTLDNDIPGTLKALQNQKIRLIFNFPKKPSINPLLLNNSIFIDVDEHSTLTNPSDAVEVSIEYEPPIDQPYEKIDPVLQRKISTLKSFLSDQKNPGLKKELDELGLAPEQSANELTGDNFTCFKILISELNSSTDKDKAHALLSVLEQLYPAVAKRYWLDQADQQISKEKAKGSNRDQAILQLLTNSVVGQQMAIERLSTALAKQESSDKANQKFIFVGPSGVGKTEMAKAIAGIKGRMIYFDMESFAQEWSYGKLFGAHIGYIGSADKPRITKEIEKLQPKSIKSEGGLDIAQVSNAVVIFNEMEKAHHKIKNSLLTFMDEGRFQVEYTDNLRNVHIQYQFEKSIFICTSNLYQEAILEAFQDNLPVESIAALFKRLNASERTENSYPTEFLGRMEIIPFGPITSGAPYQFAIDKALSIFTKSLTSSYKEVDIQDKPSVLKTLEQKLYGDGTDLRRIQRYFNQVETALNQAVANHGVHSTKKITLYSDKSELFLKISMFVKSKLSDRYVDIIPAIRLP